MRSLIRAPKDFWSGAIFITFGVLAVIIGSEYSMGTAGRMGPAYFPSILGWLLTAIGAVCVLRALITKSRGEDLGQFALKGLLLVVGGSLLFGLLVRGAGLVIAIIVLVMLAGYASKQFKLLPFAAVATGMATFCVVVFVIGLGLPMPIVGSWLGN